MSAVVDRNLLFGLLALQLDFISQDQLSDAINAWSRQKHRPLGEVLVERGALTSADLAALAPVVGRHIARHEGDPTRSLATLSTMGLVRQKLASVGDREIQSSLTHLPETRIARTVPPPSAPTTAERFTIVRPHARGGLGEVFVARDQELNRHVALKRMQERHADDPVSQSLFIAEGEITGGLEHPGIIPVYGLGKSDNGRPDHAMRFVQGETLQGAIERFHRPDSGSDSSARNLAFRELLGRFLDVCNAVAYAHQRGVLHRDLKPANVLLGAFGETLVIDWGMAKILGKTSREAPLVEPLHLNSNPLATVGRGAHGTPGYMSPEQAGGRIDELGPTTDIYSLGATLYHLLTGRPSWTKQDGDPIAFAQRGVFPPPRQLKPDLPQALEAICLKAMAFVPARRYATVSALTEDVKHWLADEPVGAWREPWLPRARRWMRKHPGRMAGAAATVLVGLFAVVIATLLLGAKNRVLAAALTRETTERERADERTKIGLEAFRTHVFAINRWTENTPKSQELRRLLLEGAVEGLEQLSAEGEDSDDADRTRMGAHMALGDIALQLNGDLKKARQEFEQALAMARALVDQAPRDARALRDLAVVHDRMGDLLLRFGETERALEEHRKALKVRLQLEDEEPDDKEVQRDLSVSHERLGKLYQKQNRPEEALREFKVSLKISTQLADVKSGDARAQHDLAIAHNQLGQFYLNRNELADASKHFEEGLLISKELTVRFPEELIYQSDLSTVHEGLGDVYYRRKENDKAAPHYEECWRIRQRLVQADPANRESQRNLKLALDRIGDLALRRSDFRAALLKCLESLRIGQSLAEEAQQDVRAQEDLASNLNKLGDVAGILTRSAADGDELFDSARLLARCVALTPATKREPLALSTLAVLRKARAEGALSDRKRLEDLRNSADFAALRARPDFLQLLP